jgi:hypothetical protein
VACSVKRSARDVFNIPPPDAFRTAQRTPYRRLKFCPSASNFRENSMMSLAARQQPARFVGPPTRRELAPGRTRTPQLRSRNATRSCPFPVQFLSRNRLEKTVTIPASSSSPSPSVVRRSLLHPSHTCLVSKSRHGDVSVILPQVFCL